MALVIDSKETVALANDARYAEIRQYDVSRATRALIGRAHQSLLEDMAEQGDEGARLVIDREQREPGPWVAVVVTAAVALVAAVFALATSAP